MAVVFEAYQGELGRHVALKLLPERGDLPRFRREARAAGRLHHTNIVPVFGVGERDGRHYLVMQYIDGQGLDAWLAAHGAVGPREAARIGVQVAEALAYAHGQGVVHRDVKPSNLLLDGAGTVWITDFGLARDAAEGTLTDTGELMGTLRYMAPERFLGRGDERADLYGLGVTLYELACGRPAYEDADRAVLLDRLMHRDRPRPREVAPTIPRDLETIIFKAMAREPSGRYATAGEMAEDLRRFLEDRPIKARPVGAIERAWRWRRRHPEVAGLLAALVAVFPAGFVGVVLQWRRADAEADRALDLARRADAEAGRARDQARRADAEAVRALEARALGDRRWYVAEMNLARMAWQDDQVGGMQLHLDALVPGATVEADLRGFEWYFLRRLGQGALRTIEVPGIGINAVAFSPDGRTIASSGWDGTARLWDLESGGEARVLRGSGAGLGLLASSPDGRRVVAGCWDRAAHLWDVETGREVRAFRGHMAPVIGVAFSPDGRRPATTSWDQSVKVWDVEAGQEFLTLAGHRSEVIGVAFAADGRRIASGSWDGSVRLWDSRPLTDGDRVLHEARSVVRALADRGLSASEIADRVRRDATLRRPVRRMALELIEAIPEHASRLERDAWRLVVRPGVDPSECARALRHAEAACRALPEDGLLLGTLGAALYRMGRDAEAIAALGGADALDRALFGGVLQPRDLAFLALARHRLGLEQAAHEALSTPREALKAPERAQDPEALALLREAELIERDDAFPPDPVSP